MMEKNKSYNKTDYKRELYDALVKSYQTDKDLFDTYGEVFMLKRSRDDRDKDQDPSARSDRGTKRRKSSKEAESLMFRVRPGRSTGLVILRKGQLYYERGKSYRLSLSKDFKVQRIENKAKTSEEWDASNPEFHALFILEDGASVARIWRVKGCTIIAIIYDLGVTVGEVRRTWKIVRRTWCVIK
ncbi:hypothetical protein Tco_0005416 [Tanacetum coccineum]